MADLLTQMPVQFEPKQTHRFVLRFPSELGIQEWVIKSTSRPKYTSNTVDIEFLNTKNYVAGKYSWDSISVTLRDPIGPSTAQAVMEWVRLHSESVTGRQGYAASYKKNVTLDILDPVGVPVEKWLLVNCMVTNADFGTVDYGSDGLLEITIDLQPERCILLF